MSKKMPKNALGGSKQNIFSEQQRKEAKECFLT